MENIRQDARIAYSFSLFLFGPLRVFPSNLENFLSRVIILLFRPNQNEIMKHSLCTAHSFSGATCSECWSVFLREVAAGIWDRTSRHCGSLQGGLGSTHQVPLNPLSM